MENPLKKFNEHTKARKSFIAFLVILPILIRGAFTMDQWLRPDMYQVGPGHRSFLPVLFWVMGIMAFNNNQRAFACLFILGETSVMINTFRSIVPSIASVFTSTSFNVNWTTLAIISLYGMTYLVIVIWGTLDLVFGTWTSPSQEAMERVG